MIAVPSNCGLTGIKGMLISRHESQEDYLRDAFDPYNRYLGANVALGGAHNDRFIITYQFEAIGHPGKYTFGRTYASKQELVEQINAPVEKFLDVADYKLLATDNSYDEHDKLVRSQSIQNMLRFIGGVAVLNNLTNSQIIQPGSPGFRFAAANKMPDGARATSIVMPTLDPDDKKAMHHRRWHIRTLRDERFYKGEYANLERGSRVILVKDSVINKRAEPQTAEMSM
jgi:hypothetical protein